MYSTIHTTLFVSYAINRTPRSTLRALHSGYDNKIYFFRRRPRRNFIPARRTSRYISSSLTRAPAPSRPTTRVNVPAGNELLC